MSSGKNEVDQFDLMIDDEFEGDFSSSSSNTKHVVLTPSAAKILFADLPKEHQFWTKEGKGINNLEELLKELLIMTDDVFYHHVSNDNNDFANWVKEILGEAELADRLTILDSKEGHADILKKYIDIKKTENAPKTINSDGPRVFGDTAKPEKKKENASSVPRSEPRVFGDTAKPEKKKESAPSVPRSEPRVFGDTAKPEKKKETTAPKASSGNGPRIFGDTVKPEMKKEKSKEEESIENKITHPEHTSIKENEANLLKDKIINNITDRKEEILGTIEQLKKLETEILEQEKQLEKKEFEINKLEEKFVEKESLVKEKHAKLQNMHKTTN